MISCDHLQLVQRSSGFPDCALPLYRTFNLSDFCIIACMASTRLYKRLLFCPYPDTIGQQKRLQPRLAFVPCVSLPLLVFQLHTLKSWFYVSRSESGERPHKRYTSSQRPLRLYGIPILPKAKNVIQAFCGAVTAYQHIAAHRNCGNWKL